MRAERFQTSATIKKVLLSVTTRDMLLCRWKCAVAGVQNPGPMTLWILK